MRRSSSRRERWHECPDGAEPGGPDQSPPAGAPSPVVLAPACARGAGAARVPRHDPRRRAHAGCHQGDRQPGPFHLLGDPSLPRRRRSGRDQHLGDAGGRGRRHRARRFSGTGASLDAAAGRPVDSGGQARRRGPSRCRPGRHHRAARRRDRRPARPLLPRARRSRRTPVGLQSRHTRAPAQLPGSTRTSHPLRLRPRQLSHHRLPERVRHRARLGRDAQRRAALHARGAHPTRGQGRRCGPAPAPHRGGLAGGERTALRRVLPRLRYPPPIASTTRGAREGA